MPGTNIDEINGIKVISERSSYLWAYVSLLSDLEIIRRLNREFPRHAEVLHDVTYLLEETNEDITKKIRKLSESIDKISEVSRKGNMKRVYISLDESDEAGKLLYNGIVRSRGSELIREMSLIYIVSMLESFLQKTLLISFQKKPEILMTSQKNITYEELFKIANMRDARMEIMQKETMVVNEDIAEIGRYIIKKFDMDISQFVDWKEFTERFYRRNILIHNSGIPNSIYRLKTGYKGENIRLDVSEDYLNMSIDLFEKISFKISMSFEKQFG